MDKENLTNLADRAHAEREEQRTFSHRAGQCRYACSKHSKRSKPRWLVLRTQFGITFWACPVPGCPVRKPCKSGKRISKRELKHNG